MNLDDWGKGYDAGLFYARSISIELILKGTNEPVQTATLKALQRDRRRIAMLIAGDNKDLRTLVDSYTMARKENKV
jgi:hypothetical protein